MRYFGIMVMLLMLGCTTPEQSVKEPDIQLVRCPTVNMTYRAGQSYADHDMFNQRSAERGCKRIYGFDSCLIRIVKVGPEDYLATCKRFPT